jgi:hypothetical protein
LNQVQDVQGGAFVVSGYGYDQGKVGFHKTNPRPFRMTASGPNRANTIELLPSTQGRSLAHFGLVDNNILLHA